MSRPIRTATVAELKVLGHPLRWRILRLCLDQALTNQQIAQQLEMSPATTLRHVRALVKTEFLEASEVRTGTRGSLERPYRATGRTRGLVALDLDAAELVQQRDFALLSAHRAELAQAGPDASRDIARGVLRLTEASQDELKRRLGDLLAEFEAREDPTGEPLSYLWSIALRPAHP
ncbi:winged helix-turn-helix domain-containing protein [Allokutzneria sp. A3M-2-11 16]|uniref:ArsR/SmtB family transcription factor n=1 Tax=Allokutzneria sp. A3M-2-11 16 TaxID=2962043 RepID=UPI0020B77348|nr:winged helix-turn-helix domain-containing protein [Allokutzneria sp. A3M-2-11 16]MCP3802899.1 winged helix-turn-helix domain-containing protein [Allokutzneria sp. A3M-2-11 16]